MGVDFGDSIPREKIQLEDIDELHPEFEEVDVPIEQA